MVSNDNYARDARFLLRRAIRASLATLDRETGTPYASLVGVASLADATPVILISSLARHTQNIEADTRASLLVETVDAEGDGLAAGRATIMGRIMKSDDEAARRRYLARHPAAETYAGFADFAFYELHVNEVHIVQGFGRIRTMSGNDFLLARPVADTMAALEPSAIAHMNDDHPDAVELYARQLCGASGENWRVFGVDAEGLDIAGDGVVTRLDFPRQVGDGETLRQLLGDLARQARAA